MLDHLLNNKIITEVFTEEEKAKLADMSLDDLNNLKLVNHVGYSYDGEESPVEPAKEEKEPTKEEKEPTKEPEVNPVEDDEDLPVVDEE